MREKEVQEIYKIFNKTFRDIALTFGGIALENNIKDQIITDFANSLEDVYYEALQGLEKLTKKTSFFDPMISKPLHPHPAIEELLKIFNLSAEAGNIPSKTKS
ncbi:MAG: hypothetical protein JRI96_12120 [Deltaproteobacteria bacterium]|nr:hypothetical protein [Deltaproteobacteria bacterium]